jgi:hypothetical protein
MAGLRHILRGFIAGEISPLLLGRTETDQYRYGLATCENWIPLIEGPLAKRPGFSIIREAASTSTWLSAFRFSVTQEYVVEWGEETARFFTNGGRIETAPGVAYEVATPYPAAEVARICTQQNFDRLYLFHELHAPAALRRTGATTFAHETLALVNGPFADGNSDEAATVYASASTGSVDLVSSTAIFDAGHVGAPFQLEAVDFGNVVQWEAGRKAIVAGNLCHNEGKVYVALTSGTTGQVPPTHGSGAFYDGQLTNDLLNDTGPYGVKWDYRHDLFGELVITAVASGTAATATVTRRLPDTVVGAPNATWRWAHGAFSEAAGWPALGTVYRGRMVMVQGLDVIGSVVNDYGGGRVNFATISNTGELADDLAFRRRIDTDTPPHWMVRDRKLLLGTARRELAVGALTDGEALTGQNIASVEQSYYGSEAIWPVQAGTETVFVERGGQRLRAADYEFARDRYDAPDLTAAAGHITGPGVVQLDYQPGTRAIYHAVRSDGQIAVHPKSRQDIKGFARYVLGGGARAISGVSIVGEDGRTQELWLLVERLAGDGETLLREIWKQEPMRELGAPLTDAFYVDGGVRIAASAGQTVFSGLDHLALQDVAVLADGGVVPAVTVAADGSMTLPETAVPADRPYTVIVGLGYSAAAVGLRPEAETRGGSIQGVSQKIVRITLRLLETLGIRVGQFSEDESDGGPLEELIDRPTIAAMDAAIPLFTGDRPGTVDAAFDRNGIPRWISDLPLPAIVA